MPALAQTEDELTGLDRARQAMQEALEYSANDLVEAPPTLPPGPAAGNPGKANPGRANPGKGNSETNPGKGNSETNPGKGNSGELTGRARAAAAIASAIARGHGNNLGRSHALEVIQMLRDGTTPASLETDGNHGAEVSAMVKAYNELKAQARTAG